MAQSRFNPLAGESAIRRSVLVPLLSMACLVTCLPRLSAQTAPQLGEPPVAPKDLSVFPTPGPRPESVTSGFNVNINSREQVRSFFNAVYRSSDGVPINSTAIITNCFAGTNDAPFYDAVARRINWYRAMAGVPAIETFSAGNCTHDQAAALLMSANTNLSHFPPPTWSCFSADGANAASNSDLSLGNYGPDAINGFIQDYGSPNYPVGHRRWLLYPQTQIMGTGDVPAQDNYMGANATWVLDANYGGPRPATRTPYVSWPPPGFTPYQAVFPRWSFAYPGANFANATVTMTSNGVPVSVAQETYDPNSYGENTLVWVPMGLDQNNYGTIWPFSGTDTVYSVTVSNVVGASSTKYTYTVTIFDPAVPGADYFPPMIGGTNQVVVGQAAAYTFTPITNATSYQWLLATRASFNFLDGAENGLTNFTAVISPGYPIITNDSVASGSEAYHLAMPQGEDQILTLNHVLFPATNTILLFASELGLAASGQIAKVQASTDGGNVWTDLYSQAGDSTWGETAFTNRTISLAGFAGQSTVIRFDYSYLAGSGYYYQTESGYPGFYVGWYLDNIVITNAAELVNPFTNSVATTNFTFTASQAGNYTLQARAFIFTDFPLGWGPIKLVNAVPAPVIALVLSQPVLTAGQVRLDFTLQSGSASSFHLLRSSQPNGPWTTNSGATLTTNIPGSSYRFTTTTNGQTQFYRIQTP